MFLEVRYSRLFLLDLHRLPAPAYKRVYEFVFFKFPQLHRIEDLPELRQLSVSPIFYRFTIDEYLVAIEITGHLIKFLRILPPPGVGRRRSAR